MDKFSKFFPWLLMLCISFGSGGVLKGILLEKGFKTFSDGYIQCLLCQVCETFGHQAYGCPSLYTRCRRCEDIGRLWVSHTAENPDRKFLKCLSKTCKEFQWLDVAMHQGHLSLKKSSCSHSCQHCGESDHSSGGCPWINTPCEEVGCQGIRVLKVSKSIQSINDPIYLKCYACGKFEYFSKAKMKKKKSELRVKVKVDLDELCEGLKIRML